MGIPPLQVNGELPPGEHAATLNEIESMFGKTNDQRKHLMFGLHKAVENFTQSGVKTIWINGSFITDKTIPNDIDGCWQYTPNVNIEKIDTVFLQPSRKHMKAKYGLDFFIGNIIEAGSGLPFPKFFQVNRKGDPKGILVLSLGESL